MLSFMIIDLVGTAYNFFLVHIQITGAVNILYISKTGLVLLQVGLTGILQ